MEEKEFTELLRRIAEHYVLLPEVAEALLQRILRLLQTEPGEKKQP